MIHHRPARFPGLLALGVTALALGAAPAAQADTLETPVAGGANLASAAGWQAWSAERADGTHRLRLRRPDGAVITPAIPAFGAPVDPAIGTRGGGDGINTPASRRLSAVYSRCAGPSSLSGCDVHALNLTTLKEARVPALATRAYSETAPSLNLGNWSVVRRGGGPRPGVYGFRERSGALRRLTSTLARETATSQSRVLFSYRTSRGFGVQLRRSSGDGPVRIAASGLDRLPVSLQLTRYRAGWLLPRPDATRAFLTARFVGSEGRQYPLGVHEASRTLPAGVLSAAGDSSRQFTHYLDADGIQRIDPAVR